jgi:uncharacterized protein YpmS
MARFDVRNSRVKTIRRLVAYALLPILLWVFYIAAGRALCYIAMRQIAGLTNTKITTESVEFHTDGSVYIKNLVIGPYNVRNPYEKPSNETILSADNVYARFSLRSFLSLRPRLKVIDVSNFVFNARHDLDTGQWNLSALKIMPLKNRSGAIPSIHLAGGMLEYTKVSQGRAWVALRTPLDARFDLEEKNERGYSFEITTATMASGFGKSRLTGHWTPGRVTLAGGMSSVDVPKLEMAGIVDVLAAELTYDQDDAFTLKLKIKGLDSKRSPALRELASAGPAFLEKSGPLAALQKFFEQYEPSGKIDLDLQASGNLKRLSASTLSGTVYCRDVAFCDQKFRYPIKHLAGRIDFTEHSVKLNNLIGKHGDVELFFDGSSKDAGSCWQYQIRIRSDKMSLDSDLYDALNTREQKFWYDFSPTGFAAIDCRLSRTSPTEKHDKLTVELRGGSAVYRHFPYPLKNLSGGLTFDGNNVTFSHVVSQAGERKIDVNGEIRTDPSESLSYDVSIQVNNIPLDSTLEAALPQRQKDVYRQFSPAGIADGRIDVSATNGQPMSFTADLSFKKTSLNCDLLPFAISDLTARAVFTPDLIVVKDFSGRHKNGLVSLTGQIRPLPEHGQCLYDVALKLDQTQLNSDLLNLLPPSLKGIVSDLKPEGKVNARLDLNKTSLAKPPEYSATLKCLNDSIILPSQCYLLKNITGTLTIDADQIKLDNIAAVIGDDVPIDATQPTIKLNGRIAMSDQAFSSAVLDLDANDVRFDEQLARALPLHVQPLYDELSPDGTFDLNFKNIHVLRTDNGGESIDFAGAVRLNTCGFNVSGSKMELDAALTTEGTYKTGEGLTACRAILDDGTIRIKGKSLTGLKANVLYDPSARQWSTEDLVADFYGGKLKGKLTFKQPAGQAGEYVLETGFDNVDLKQFLADTDRQQVPQNGHTSGKMSGSFSVSAQIDDNASRIGACKLKINDMQVGKLSPLAKLLIVVQLTEPQAYAFDQMFVDSYIKHNLLLVKKLDLSGRDIAFYGSGQMNLQTQNVDLSLIARGRRLATDDPSIFQSLTEGLGQGVVRMNVTGNFHDPKVTTKALPVIESTLQILGGKPAPPG